MTTAFVMIVAVIPADDQTRHAINADASAHEIHRDYYASQI